MRIFATSAASFGSAAIILDDLILESTDSRSLRDVIVFLSGFPKCISRLFFLGFSLAGAHFDTPMEPLEFERGIVL